MQIVWLSGLCICLFIHITLGLPESEHHIALFATAGQSINLPCGKSYTKKSCASTKWTMWDQYGSNTEVVFSGRVTDKTERSRRLGVGHECSLHIRDIQVDDGRLYTCGDGTINSNVSLELLNVSELKCHVRNGMQIELQCYLTTFVGIPLCNHSKLHHGVHLEWLTEDNTPLRGQRFNLESPSICFSKLKFISKRTDHHRTWRCQLVEGDTVKTFISHRMTLSDGIEEVFVAVDESFSLTCGGTYFQVGSRMQWVLGEKSSVSQSDSLAAGLPNKNTFSDPFVISKVSSRNSGNYYCVQNLTDVEPLRRIQLHTLDITTENANDTNITLICLLTCANLCDNDFSLTWTGLKQEGLESTTFATNTTMTSKLLIQEQHTHKYAITCSVLREGVEMASKKWNNIDTTISTAAWLALPLVLLLFAVGGRVFLRRKCHKNEDVSTGIGMTHIYDVPECHNTDPTCCAPSEKGTVNVLDVSATYSLLRL